MNNSGIFSEANVAKVQKFGADLGSDSMPGYFDMDFFLTTASSSFPTLEVLLLKGSLFVSAGTGSLDLNRFRKKRLIFPESSLVLAPFGSGTSLASF